MKRILLLGSLCPLLLSAPLGCHSAPGWRIGWEVYQPPLLTAATPLTPVASQPQPVMAIEEVQAPLRIQRRMVVSPAMQADCAPGPEPLPVMPRKMPTAPPPP